MITEPADKTRLVVTDENGDSWTVIRNDHWARDHFDYTLNSHGIPTSRWFHGHDDDHEDYPVTFAHLQTLGTLNHIGATLRHDVFSRTVLPGYLYRVSFDGLAGYDDTTYQGLRYYPDLVNPETKKRIISGHDMHLATFFEQLTFEKQESFRKPSKYKVTD